MFFLHLLLARKAGILGRGGNLVFRDERRMNKLYHRHSNIRMVWRTAKTEGMRLISRVATNRYSTTYFTIHCLNIPKEVGEEDAGSGCYHSYKRPTRQTVFPIWKAPGF